jgi:hypothetical protein
MIDYEEARVEEAIARWPDAQETGDSLVILLILTRAGLAHCFTHLADTADHIVGAVTA